MATETDGAAGAPQTELGAAGQQAPGMGSEGGPAVETDGPQTALPETHFADDFIQPRPEMNERNRELLHQAVEQVAENFNKLQESGVVINQVIFAKIVNGLRDKWADYMRVQGAEPETLREEVGKAAAYQGYTETSTSFGEIIIKAGFDSQGEPVLHIWPSGKLYRNIPPSGG